MAQSYNASDIEVLAVSSRCGAARACTPTPRGPTTWRTKSIDNSVDEAHRRALQAHRRHALQGRLARGHRRRPRHAGGHPPGGEGQRRRADPHAPARRRQIQRQDLQLLRRPARRRRVGGQRAVQAPGMLGAPRRQGIQHRLQGRAHRTRSSKSSATVGKRNTGTTVRFWPDPKFFDSDRVLRSRSSSTCSRPRRCCVRACASASATRRPARRTSGSTPAAWASTWRSSWQGRAPAAPSRSPAARVGAGRGRVGAGLVAPTAPQLVAESYVNLIPTTAGRHARQRPARRPRRRGARVLRVPQPAAARHQADAPRTSGTGPATCCRSRCATRSSPARPRRSSARARPRRWSRRTRAMPCGLWLNQHPDAGERHRRSSRSPTRRSGCSAATARGAQARRQRPGAAGQARRLHLPGSGALGAVPGRRRFGRRLGQAGARPGVPGHHAAARQDPEHLGSSSPARSAVRRKCTTSASRSASIRAQPT